MRHNVRPVRLTLTLALVVVAAACGGGDGSAGGADLEVRARDLAFEPDELRLEADRKYTIVLKNDGAELHDWTIDTMPATGVSAAGSSEHGEHGAAGGGGARPPLHVASERGKKAELSFTPTRSGEYVFYCTVSGHRAAGMEGRLIVEERSQGGQIAPTGTSDNRSHFDRLRDHLGGLH